MNVAQQLSRLKPKSRKALEQILRRIRETKSLDILDSFNAIDYEREVVPAHQFLEDDYYLGKSLKNLSCVWKDEFADIFARDSVISTVVCTGAIGTGKTTFAAACFSRKLYELSCLKDPALFHGLLTRSKVVFGIYNITLDKADDCTSLIEEYISESPYFQEKCPLRQRPRYPLYFPSKRLEVSSGSLSTHALGDNVLGFILDEANFFKKAAKQIGTTEKSRAHQLFNAARIRQITRFMRAGKMPGLVMLLSSKKFQSEFLDEFVNQVAANVELQAITRIIQLALWQTKNPEDFSGKSFEVLIGTEHFPSQILEFDEVPPEGGEVIRVPEEYREPFTIDPDLALRDIAGVSTSGTVAFFPVKAKVLSCIDKMRTHPFAQPVISIPFKLQGGIPIDDYFLERKVCRIEQSSWRPLVHPGVDRHIHVDLALNEECIGLAMAHPYMMNDSRFGVYVDFVLRIKPPTRGELELSSVIEFVKLLRNTYKFRIKKVTFDQYQSRMPIQLLLQAGFQTELLSVDLVHYNHLKVCFSERRINVYEYGPLLEEVDHLLKDPAGGRPNHETGWNDDVLDALAAVVSRCYNVDNVRSKKGNLEKDRVRLGENIGSPVLVVNQEHTQEEFRS